MWPLLNPTTLVRTRSGRAQVFRNVIFMPETRAAPTVAHFLHRSPFAGIEGGSVALEDQEGDGRAAPFRQPFLGTRQSEAFSTSGIVSFPEIGRGLPPRPFLAGLKVTTTALWAQ